MRILFDQGTPVPLRAALSEHEVSTAYERGWSTLRNGELLDSAELAGIDVLVTTDQNIRHQQDLSTRRISDAADLYCGSQHHQLASNSTTSRCCCSRSG